MTNKMPTTLGSQAEFQETWQALMRKLEKMLSIAHLRRPNRTETDAVVSDAKQLLVILGEQLMDAAEGQEGSVT
jgi:hypothetical protein